MLSHTLLLLVVLLVCEVVLQSERTHVHLHVVCVFCAYPAAPGGPAGACTSTQGKCMHVLQSTCLCVCACDTMHVLLSTCCACVRVWGHACPAAPGGPAGVCTLIQGKCMHVLLFTCCACVRVWGHACPAFGRPAGVFINSRQARAYAPVHMCVCVCVTPCMPCCSWSPCAGHRICVAAHAGHAAHRGTPDGLRTLLDGRHTRRARPHTRRLCLGVWGGAERSYMQFGVTRARSHACILCGAHVCACTLTCSLHAHERSRSQDEAAPACFVCMCMYVYLMNLCMCAYTRTLSMYVYTCTS